MVKLQKLDAPNCPYTLREFKSIRGEYCLKSNVNNAGNAKSFPFIKYLKLCKKESFDGLDTYRLVAQKSEHPAYQGLNIIKNLFNNQGNLSEVSKIEFDIAGNRILSVKGDSLEMSKGLVIRNKFEVNSSGINLKLNINQKLTPMAKRVLGYIKNFK